MKVKTILLIDDNKIDSYITRHLLLKNKIGEIFIIQSSAIEALRYLDSIRNDPKHFPDCIFLDIRMPEMDGFEFLDEYVLLPDTIKNKCDIFMLSSSNDQRDIDRAAHYSYVKRFLMKPLNVDILKMHIQEAG
ncbi:response regulator [Confluentibacter flavum]|uniref:Response regulator n=1 Tax=Confluentibacter flavum TaxID=1909700 RepID=A0A2N3HJ84_9FLAO|nr:response regulator [Confluentibacter flavum]PKQ45001.1 response regulator [Confluentibacter flavum]